MVDLPEPDGPMMATYSLRRMSRLTPRRARIRSLAHVVLAGQVADPDDASLMTRPPRSVSVVSACADPGAVLEVADGLVGAGHDGLALAQPVDHLEVLVARDARP